MAGFTSITRRKIFRACTSLRTSTFISTSSRHSKLQLMYTCTAQAFSGHFKTVTTTSHVRTLFLSHSRQYKAQTLNAV